MCLRAHCFNGFRINLQNPVSLHCRWVFSVFTTNFENLFIIKCKRVSNPRCLRIIYKNACSCVPTALSIFTIHLEHPVHQTCNLGKPSEKKRPCSKSVQALFASILGKYMNFGTLQSYLTVVQNGPIQKLPHRCPKWRGGR